MQQISTPQNKQRAVDVLVRSFAKDPVSNYVSPAEGSRKAFFQLSVNYLAAHTYLYEENKAAAVWFKSGEANKNGIWQLLLSPLCTMKMLYYSSLRRGGELMNVMDNIDKVEKQKLSSYPKYYYIYFLAVDPDHQGQGLGSKLLKEIISRADSENCPVLLEASSERNRKLYLSHGFEEFDVFTMRDDPNVKLWLMLRKPST
jgi:ribosomal protein S18 acetylase RimI-like enzyme